MDLAPMNSNINFMEVQANEFMRSCSILMGDCILGINENNTTTLRSKPSYKQIVMKNLRSNSQDTQRDIKGLINFKRMKMKSKMVSMYKSNEIQGSDDQDQLEFSCNHKIIKNQRIETQRIQIRH